MRTRCAPSPPSSLKLVTSTSRPLSSDCSWQKRNKSHGFFKKKKNVILSSQCAPSPSTTKPNMSELSSRACRPSFKRRQRNVQAFFLGIKTKKGKTSWQTCRMFLCESFIKVCSNSEQPHLCPGLFEAI